MCMSPRYAKFAQAVCPTREGPILTPTPSAKRVQQKCMAGMQRKRLTEQGRSGMMVARWAWGLAQVEGMDMDMDAYHEGWEAATGMQPREDCPYDLGTVAWESWQQGWYAGWLP